MRHYAFFLSVLAAVLMAGCSSKATIKVLQPAEVDRAAKTKKLAVLAFENDQVGIRDNIETALASASLENRPYFTMISRKDLGDILEEQRLNQSGLIADDSAVEVGSLLGAEGLVIGRVNSVGSADEKYSETRSRCMGRDRNNHCVKWQRYQVGCIRRSFHLQVTVRMLDVERGDLIYGDILEKQSSYGRCRDEERALPSRQEETARLSRLLAQSFAAKLIPSYRHMEVVLLEKGDTDYSDRAEELLESGIAFAEGNRMDRAEEIFSRLIQEAGEQSYVARYNLGVIKEALGKTEEARRLYREADRLTLEPVEEISRALQRIEKRIRDDRQAKAQIES